MGHSECVMLMRRYKIILFVFVVLCCSPFSTNGQWDRVSVIYEEYTLNALQVLWGEWNKTTPNAANNLAGWSSTQTFPCWNNNVEAANPEHPNWRGVQCLENVNCSEVPNLEHEKWWECNGYVIGLSLNNASVSGHLPQDIGDIRTLTTLELTGNPELSGPLPVEIKYPSLYILDLHDNAFSGNLPDLSDMSVVTVDLSGNQFNGTFPLRQIHTWVYLQSLKLARNSFTGDIPQQAFENMTQLATLDLSSNQFTGGLPALTRCKHLQYLDMSNNSFNGSLPDLTMLTSLFTMYLDDNQISGTLNLTRFFALGSVKSKSGNASKGLIRILLFKNNSISNIIYPERNVGNISTVFRATLTAEKTDDNTRCFCQQTCFDSEALKAHNRRIVIISAAVSSTSALALLLVIVAAVLYRTRRYHRYLQLQALNGTDASALRTRLDWELESSIRLQ